VNCETTDDHWSRRLSPSGTPARAFSRCDLHAGRAGKNPSNPLWREGSGRAIRSELIETSDFISFRMSPLKGDAARNKGTLFPRKIGGKYAMIARQDNENLYLIYSDDLHTWDGGQPILNPRYLWEFVQIGNCGSPIELDEGWLLLTQLT
jgi:predicted GH43/DUF377 family glycosyl hydrolase